MTGVISPLFLRILGRVHPGLIRSSVLPQRDIIPIAEQIAGWLGVLRRNNCPKTNSVKQ